MWDVKAKRESLTLNNLGRKPVSAVAWHPEQQTKLITAVPDDTNPVILVWDLKNSNAPERVSSLKLLLLMQITDSIRSFPAIAQASFRSHGANRTQSSSFLAARTTGQSAGIRIPARCWATSPLLRIGLSRRALTLATPATRQPLLTMAKLLFAPSRTPTLA